MNSGAMSAVTEILHWIRRKLEVCLNFGRHCYGLAWTTMIGENRCGAIGMRGAPLAGLPPQMSDTHRNQDLYTDSWFRF
jgi:hypothetical protein